MSDGTVMQALTMMLTVWTLMLYDPFKAGLQLAVVLATTALAAAGYSRRDPCVVGWKEAALYRRPGVDWWNWLRDQVENRLHKAGIPYRNIYLGLLRLFTCQHPDD